VESLADLSELATRSIWLEFSAGSRWFAQVAWDFGIAAIRPDRRSIAALAATDED
jgi:hypothetical protein